MASKPSFQAGLVGYPVAQSRSPQIFKAINYVCNRAVKYRLYEISEGNFKNLVAKFKAKKLRCGLNVTIPYKELALKLADRADKVAAQIGAANVLLFSNGTVTAYNTDTVGLSETFKRFNCVADKTLVYGAGGAARAVIFALASRGAKQIYLTNRTPLRASKLLKEFRPVFPNTKFRCTSKPETVKGVTLIINTTPPTGRRGSIQFPKPDKFSTAFDLDYRMAVTPFLRQATKLGYRSINGRTMLVWQAVASWERWLGRMPQRQKIANRILEEWGDK